MGSLKIRPISVPWLISPSGSFITLNFIEEGESAVATAYAFFGKHHKEYLYSVTQGSWIAIPKEKGKSGDFVILQDGYYEVRIQFYDLLSAIIIPKENIRSVIVFDNLFPWEIEVTGGRNYLNDFETTWNSSAYCPESGFYEVFEENSNVKNRKFILMGNNYSLIVESHGFISL